MLTRFGQACDPANSSFLVVFVTFVVSSSESGLGPENSALAVFCPQVHVRIMNHSATFTARLLRDGEWFIAFSPEFPEGNGQGITEQEALTSLRESILLLLEDRREEARANLAIGEKLIPLALA